MLDPVEQRGLRLERKASLVQGGLGLPCDLLTSAKDRQAAIRIQKYRLVDSDAELSGKHKKRRLLC